MTISVIRTFILYIAVMLGLRLMGKRQIGELQPSELVITIMFGNLAAVPMQETGIPLINGIAPIITLVFIEVMLSAISLKSKRFRRFISGSPSIIIRRGEIDLKELRRLRMSMDDVMEALRSKDIVNIDDVETAILDTDGEICIVPKAAKRPLTPEDLALSPKEEEMPYTIISDGRIITDNLNKINKSEKWLMGEIKKKKLAIPDVLLANYTRDGKLCFKKKENNN
ncbi:MAG: DUF421 domain-containing protein [Clostridia bacterium]|nr:DUF421 domain-containing protein [Clostridia bacterium]